LSIINKGLGAFFIYNAAALLGSDLMVRSLNRSRKYGINTSFINYESIFSSKSSTCRNSEGDELSN